MNELTCQDCHASLLVADDYLERGMADGSIIEGDYKASQKVDSGADDVRDVYVHALLHICQRCQIRARVIGPKGGPVPQRRMSVEDEGAAIQRIMDHVRFMHPDWTLEDAAREAVERFNDPAKVADAGFRHYLLSVHAES